MPPAHKSPSLTRWLLGLLWLAMLLWPAGHPQAATPERHRIRRVVIDPGHGGRDFGAIGRRGIEKDINLAISLQLGEYIRAHMPDVEVIFTRTQDVFVGLAERSEIANRHNADVFISIHCNSNRNATPYGTETFVMGLHKSQENLEVAMRENAVIAYEEDYAVIYEGYAPNSAESFIIFSLMQNTFLEQSLALAALIQDEFRERARRKDRGVKQAGFLVLWRNSMPSVLVEVGFLSNPREEEFLISESGQAYLASAIFRAFRRYKESVEQRSSVAHGGAAPRPRATPAASATAPPPAVAPAPAVAPPQRPEVVFRVQVAASRRPIPSESPIFRNLSGVEEIQVNGIYRYVVGSKRTYPEALEFCQQIRRYIPDAFVVAFHNGQQVTLKQAAQILSN